MNYDRPARSFDVTPKPAGTAFPALEKRRKLSAPRVKKWSHQDDLEALVGKQILLTDRNGDESKPILLLAADQFSIKVEDSKKTALVILKHGIVAFRAA